MHTWSAHAWAIAPSCHPFRTIHRALQAIQGRRARLPTRWLTKELFPAEWFPKSSTRGGVRLGSVRFGPCTHANVDACRLEEVGHLALQAKAIAESHQLIVVDP